MTSRTDDRFQVVVHVDQAVLSRQLQASLSGNPDCYIEKQSAIPVETARRLSCCSKLITAVTKGSEPLSIGRSTRAISPPIRRALAIRDGVCQFPRCDCNRNLDAHHIVHWADDGETSLNNLIELCHYHHKLMHEGGFSIQPHRVSGEWVFCNPDGSVIRRDSKSSEAGQPLNPANEDSWYSCGDSMDYYSAIEALANFKRQGPGRPRRGPKID